MMVMIADQQEFMLGTIMNRCYPGPLIAVGQRADLS